MRAAPTGGMQLHHTHDSTPAMHWRMFGPGATVEFCGLRSADGYAMSVKRETDTVMTALAPDAPALLRASSLLRERLQQLGYSTTPPATRAAVLQAGPCWGPATPLQPIIIETLR